MHSRGVVLTANTRAVVLRSEVLLLVWSLCTKHE